MTFIVNSNNSDNSDIEDNSDRNNSDQDDEDVDVDNPRHVLEGMANEDVDEALSRCEQI